MKLIDNKKPHNLGGLGVLNVNQLQGKSTMNTLTQNFATANNQALVIGEFKIRQDEDGRYCLNDLHKASGSQKKHQPAFFLRNEQTKELIYEIDQELSSANLQSCVKSVNGVGTFAAKELIYSYAMWISAKFHLTVIRAYDALVMQWKLNDRQTISPEQQALLHEIVDRRSKGERKAFAEMWSRHNRHFKIPRYAELLAIHFPDSVHYLETMEIKAKPSNEVQIDKIYMYNAESLAIHMIWLRAWWRDFGGAIKALNPNMAGAIHDNFVDGASFASYFLNQQTKEQISHNSLCFPWHLTSRERMAITYKTK